LHWEEAWIKIAWIRLNNESLHTNQGYHKLESLKYLFLNLSIYDEHAAIEYWINIKFIYKNDKNQKVAYWFKRLQQ
jgi:hypothetical protein